jgi:hypothetical protein
VNILNKQSRTADKGWFHSFEVGRGANNSSPQKINHVTKYRKKPRDQTDPSVRPEQWKRDMRFGTWNLRSVYRSGSLERLTHRWEDNIKIDLREV